VLGGALLRQSEIGKELGGGVPDGVQLRERVTTLATRHVARWREGGSGHQEDPAMAVSGREAQVRDRGNAWGMLWQAWAGGLGRPEGNSVVLY
jgi:hypothetical protein